MNLQTGYDLWKAQQKRKKLFLKLKPFELHAIAAA